MGTQYHTAISNADFTSLAEIKSLQNRQWEYQWEYVCHHSQFYRRYFGHIAPTIPLAGLSDLPLTDKEMLRKDQISNPSFGSYLATDESNVIRMHRTSGTTGTAMNLALTAKDARITAEVGARAQRASGLGPHNKVVHCLNYQMWMGGYTDHSTLEATGAMVIPFGVGSTKKLIETIQSLKIDAISCTPSYPAALSQAIDADFPQLDPRDLGLKLALFGGKAGLDDPAFRRRLEDTWGFTARNANYGVTDVMCNFAGQSTLDNDLHFVALDVLYPELIDPDLGTPIP
ncbi:MAG: hypothetical protein GKR96_12310 [Gammaproteobacteria bacterium]|nr:hypothetical protein [Gammaproteobacteria bacterium]